MTNKYETVYSQIGACVDKLIERGFEFKTSSVQVINSLELTVLHYINNLQYDNPITSERTYINFWHNRAIIMFDGFAVKYTDPNWQEQLLNKVDELLKEEK